MVKFNLVVHGYDNQLDMPVVNTFTDITAYAIPDLGSDIYFDDQKLAVVHVSYHIDSKSKSSTVVVIAEESW